MAKDGLCEAMSNKAVKPTTRSVADVPWAMAFPTGGPFPRHPSQLYEAALEGIVLLIVLQILARALGALAAPGRITGIFVAGYAAARIFVEFFREPDVQIGYLFGGWLTMGMLLSLPMLAIGVWMIWRGLKEPVVPAAPEKAAA